MTLAEYEQDEPEIFAAEYRSNVHIFDDPGARRLWLDEVIKRGAIDTDFKLWET